MSTGSGLSVGKLRATPSRSCRGRTPSACRTAASARPAHDCGSLHEMLNGSPSMLRYANVLSLTARSRWPGHGLLVCAPGYAQPERRGAPAAPCRRQAFFFAMGRVYIAPRAPTNRCGVDVDGGDRGHPRPRAVAVPARPVVAARRPLRVRVHDHDREREHVHRAAADAALDHHRWSRQRRRGARRRRGRRAAAAVARPELPVHVAAACCTTPIGTMHGTYRFWRDDGTYFDAADRAVLVGIARAQRRRRSQLTRVTWRAVVTHVGRKIAKPSPRLCV